MNFAIAAGHERTAQAASEILKLGGNAIDAAIAALMMAWVAEPCLSSAGGGGFALVRTANGDAKVFDFFCQTPQKRRPMSEVDFFPVLVNFGDAQETFHVGKGATAMPGAVAGIFALHQQHGSLPMHELAQPAILAAKEGVPVKDFQRFSFELLAPILKLSKHGEALYFQNDQIIPVGTILKLPQLADYLDYLSREGKNAFYQGEIAQQIVQDYQANGGFLTMADFEAYEVKIRQPLHFTYRDQIILTTPEPSIGGMLIQLVLQQLSKSNAFPDYRSAAYIESLHAAFSNVNAIDKTPEKLRAALQHWQQQTWGSTTHFSIADRWGNIVSLTSSNGEGCGYFVKGTDIQLNNMLGEAVLMPKGFHSWQENVRLNSMMTPTIVLDKKLKPTVALGTGGASRIAFAIAQILHLIIDHKLPIAEAIEASRVHLEHNTFHIEAGFDDLPPANHFPQQVKYWHQRSLFFGGIHAIQQQGKTWQAVGDARRQGAVETGG